MKLKIKKIIIVAVVFLISISLGWVIYSSTKSNKEVPKRATFVMHTENNNVKEW